jgi:uncharacterized protein YciI
MLFDSFTVVLLELRADAPKLDDAATAALQDAHMSYLADLHDAGTLLACGPLLAADLTETAEPAQTVEPAQTAEPTAGRANLAFRGLNLFACAPARARELAANDPAVLAGRFRPVIAPWAVPAGAMSFAHTRLPRSMADLDDD